MKEILIALACIVIIAIIYFIFSKERYIYPTSSALQYNNNLVTDGYSFSPPQSGFTNTLVTDNTGNINTVASVPIGFIGMWAGTISTIPSGWVLCDGGNGTPDLRSRFIIGASSNSFTSSNPDGLNTYPAYSVGGEEYHALTIAEMPSHAHNAYVGNPDSNSGAAVGYSTMNGFDQGGINIPQTDSPYGQNATVYAGGDPNNQNSEKDVYGNITNQTLPHNNLPPYYALAFIMKIN